MNNGRFAISTHILTLLARNQDEFLTSDFIASSININPVLVRKEIINLRNNGLVISKEGKNGGSNLAKPAKQILLSQIYDAVREETVLGFSKNDPNPNCPVGKQINKHLGTIYSDAEDAMIQSLGQTTLADFVKKFK